MWIQCDPRLHSGFFDGVDGSMQMGTGLDVNSQNVSAQFGELSDVTIGRLNHEMDIERFGGMLSDGLDDRHAIADIGNEHPVHDIYVMPVGFTFLDHLHVTCKVAEIRSEQ